jgi:amino acid adenylation domain-containing protein/thioester reductase-like protein
MSKVTKTQSITTSEIASNGQERLWYQSKLQQPAYSYNEQFEVLVNGQLEISALEKILSTIVQRHEALRTVFQLSKQEQLQQVVLPPFAVSIPVIEVGNKRADKTTLDKLINDQCLEQGQAIYDLAKGPLFRASVLQLPDNKQLFLFSFHHIIMDGRAAVILLKEINLLYQQRSKASDQPAQPLAFQPSDYARQEKEWLQSKTLKKQLDYWAKELESLPAVLDLPIDRSRPLVSRAFGAWQSINLSIEATQQLVSTSWEQRVSPFIIILAAYKSLLMHYSRQRDIVVGSIAANRTGNNTSESLGFFAETALLRSVINPQQVFSTFLSDLDKLSNEVFYKQPVPFGKLIETLREKRVLAADTNPIQALLVFDSTALEDNNLAGQPAELSTSRSMGVAKFELTLSLEIVDDQLKGHFEYNSDLFDATTIERMAKNFEVLLESAVENPQQRIGNLPMLSQAEQQTIVSDWNNTKTSYPADQCIHQLFEQQAAQNPNATALIYRDQTVKYHELDIMANQLAHYLIAKGVQPDMPVGLYIERSVNMIIGILGILKAGGCYVPIDINHPLQRINYLINSSNIQLMLTQQSLSNAVFDNSELVTLSLDSEWHKLENHLLTAPCTSTSADNLAYINYTSGSTGQPKGVALPHRGVTRLAKNTNYLKLRPSKKMLQVSSISFDTSAFEIWASLLNGSTLVIYPEPTLSPIGIKNIISQHKIDTLFLTTSLFHMLVDEEPKAMEKVPLVIAAGETLSLEHIKRAQKKCPETLFMNAYGPTENSTFTTFEAIDKTTLDTLNTISIGRPISNTTTYILDSQYNPVPPGVIGELYLGGDGLARNYMNKPALTAEKFIPNPFSKEPGQRLYKSGDLGRYQANGSIDFCGRIDNQIKIRGYRIEIGEIEAVIDAQPYVREAVVKAHSRDKSGSNHFLAAYVVAPQGHTMDIEQLRSDLKSQLPNYMVPSIFIPMDQLPLNNSGKVDRQALPVPSTFMLESNDFVKPQTAMEKQLVAIWANVLAMPAKNISIDHDFFDLGGNSISVMRVISLCNKNSLDISVKDLFEQRTINRISKLMEAVKKSAKAVTLDREIALDSSINIGAKPWADLRNPQGIFLTGCTGFVGAFLLKELLSQTKAKIYCLTRADSPIEARTRIREKLSEYNLYRVGDCKRIVPILGDLSEKRFGLNETAFDYLAKSVDIIFHNGAWVNHVYPYDMLKAANVGGTREILRLATSNKIKSVRHISILNNDCISKEDFKRLANGKYFGYPLSKYAAEKMLQLGNRRGIPISVYRLSMVSGDEQGISNTKDRICLLIKGCIALNCIPNSEGLAQICAPSLTPVDFVAKAIVTLCKLSKSINQTFDIVSPRPMQWDELLAALKEFGYKFDVVSLSQWQEKLSDRRDTNPDSTENQTLAGLYLDEQTSTAENYFPEEPDFDDGYLPMLDTLFKAKVNCPVVDRELIKTYLKYLVERGFIPVPETISKSTDLTTRKTPA